MRENREAAVRYYCSILSLCLAYSFVLIYVYTGQLYEANAYTGVQPWEMSIAGYIIIVAGLPAVAWVVMKNRGRPSDFFRLFYGSIAIASFLVLHPIVGLSSVEIVAGFVLLILPLGLIQLFGGVLPLVKVRGFLAHNHVEYLVLFILLAIVLFSAESSPQSAGFDLGSSYARRLEGRELYPAGSFLAYGIAMAMNGIAPYLAFRAGLRSRPYLFSIAVVAAVFFYWLLGVKAPVFYVMVATVLGCFVRLDKLAVIGRWFIISVLWLGLIVVAEWVLFDGYSMIADYFFRRLFMVQAELQGYYLKFFFGPKDVLWSWWNGSFFDHDFQATYYIGEHFLGNAETNANTNAFLYQLAAGGFVGYFFAVIFVSLILTIFDQLYKTSRNPTYIFLGFLYGLLVVEQAATVALVSSGVGFLFVLTLLEINFESRNMTAVTICTN